MHEQYDVILDALEEINIQISESWRNLKQLDSLSS